ncbi:MAG: dihydrolipoyl dehydrogenase [Propionibacteriaceae bacterium]|nr:dihydrolipoyl dehydrogenase [Propionibacteriaceae bacterium]
MSEFDVIVLGGGPGGYMAAERLGQLGKSVLLIEKASLGGSCFTVGCIPTKAWNQSVAMYDHARHSAQFGVTAESVSYDWRGIQQWKTKTVSTLVGGVAQVLKRLKVKVIQGEGHMTSPTCVEVDGQTYDADDVIIATGSMPAMLSIPGAQDNPAIIDSTTLLNIDHVPERLVVIGGGVIGVEFASLLSRLGTSVTVIEMMGEILPFMDQDLAARMRACMPDVDFRLAARVESVDQSSVSYSRNGQRESVESELILMAAGRRPVVDGWGAESCGVDHSPAGVWVDDQMRTTVPHVWAVGDVTGRSFFAHAAYRMGEVAASCIADPQAAASAGQSMRWDTVPWAVYSSPEAAGVGLTAVECANRGIEVASSMAPLVLSGRFVAENGLSRAGMVKVVAEVESRVIRGIHMIGPYSAEVIWGAAAVLEMEFTVDDVRQLVFPHPTVSEGIREAVWAFPDRKRNGRT